MVRKQNVIIQLEFGQYGRQILTVPKKGSIETKLYFAWAMNVSFWLIYKGTHYLWDPKQSYLIDYLTEEFKALVVWCESWKHLFRENLFPSADRNIYRVDI